MPYITEKGIVYITDPTGVNKTERQIETGSFWLPLVLKITAVFVQTCLVSLKKTGCSIEVTEEINDKELLSFKDKQFRGKMKEMYNE